MELSLLLFFGGVAGLGAGTIALALAPLFAGSSTWRTRVALIEIVTICVHMAAGMGLALLFWLSWGLTAIVDVTWWQRGLAFAGLCWTVLCVPIGMQQLLQTHIDWRVVGKSALDALLTCTLVGLVCAWSWSNGR
jgi:hypothetical protein